MNLTRLMTQVLHAVSTWPDRPEHKHTYKEPREKMNRRDAFWNLVVCKFHTACKGNARITKSVKTFGAEPMMKNRGALMQVP